MKLAFISDLHIDKKEKLSQTILHSLQEIIIEENIDGLFIGGDISNHWSRTLSFVENLEMASQIPVYFIPGNHDFWNQQDPRESTWKLYQKYLNHPQCLLEKTLRLPNNYYLVAHTAWYNYAVHAPRFSQEQLERGLFKGITWLDKRFIHWGMRDQEVSRSFAQIMEGQLQAISLSSQIILMTHMVTTPRFAVPIPHRAFDFFNAYIVTDDLEDFYHKYPITYSIQGHVHIRHQFFQDGCHYIGNSLGYPREWWTDNVKEEMRDALFFLEI